MLIHRAYKTELNPNNKQKTFFNGSFGLARFVYNWGLETKIKQYKETGKSASWMTLGKMLVKKKQADWQWMYNYPSWVHVYALKNLDDAYNNFFRRVKQGKTPGFPKFKSRKHGSGKFAVNGQVVKTKSDQVRLPKIGWIRLKERNYIPDDVRILSATISENHGRYFISVTVEEEIPDVAQEPTNIIGIDLGIKTLAATSDGDYIENPKALRKSMKRLKRLGRIVSRRKKGGANRKKAIIQLAKQHNKVKNIRLDTLHKATSKLTRTKSVLAIENLNVSGMMKNHHLAQAIGDVGMSEFRRQLEYKSGWYGSEVDIVDRFYPSSKTCSNCGQIDSDLKLSDRMFVCDCGLNIDRDLNAAINLKQYAESRRNLRPQREHKTNSNTVGKLDEVGSRHGTMISPASLLEAVQC